MNRIKILPAKDIDRLVNITVDAYPGMGVKTTEGKKIFAQKVRDLRRDEPVVEFYGYYRQGTLNGVMACYDYLYRHGLANISG